jgi:hypothetical protein
MKKYVQFLDKLRASGKVNMYAAGAELERKFGLSREEARAILLDWMDSVQFVKPIQRKKK